MGALRVQTKSAAAKGTSLIVRATNDGLLMAADDLLYGERDGRAFPLQREVHKVFATDNFVLLGVAGLLALRMEGLEYELKSWITELIELQAATADKRPSAIAEAIYAKMRDTFKPVEVSLERGDWKDHRPGERIVTYFVGGYPESFKDPRIVELAAEVNPEGNGLRYLEPRRHSPEFAVWIGEDKFIEPAQLGKEPEISRLHDATSCAIPSVSATLPDIPEPLQKAVASTISLIKLEAEVSPDKVGTAVNVVVIDRIARKTYAASF